MNRVFGSILFWLLVSSIVAFYWPAEQVGFDPFSVTPQLLWTLIVITMLSLGTLVRPGELKPLLARPWWIALGVGTQVTVMPLAAWLVTRMFPLEEELAAGVVLVGCVPGAMASNVLTSTAKGSVAYSVSLTAIATLLSPVTVPLAVWLVAKMEPEASQGQASLLLVLLVVLPTLVGYALANWTDTVRRWMAREGAASLSRTLAAVALLWIIASIVAANRERLSSVGGWLLLALLLINVIGYLAGDAVGRVFRLPSAYRRALTLEVGMQNAGLGTALAVSLYGADTIATIPTAAYTFGCMLTGTILAVIWGRS